VDDVDADEEPIEITSKIVVGTCRDRRCSCSDDAAIKK
jgi:hypothetical protein